MTADTLHMQDAIRQAHEALASGEGIGFGAVIERNGKIVGIGRDRTVIEKDPTAHAEMNAIRAACEVFESASLDGCTLYATCELCPMCFGACWNAGIARIVYGASLEDATGVREELVVPAKYLNERGGSKIVIEAGFMREECMMLYRVD